MTKLALTLASAVLGMSSVALARPSAPVPAPAIETRDHRDRFDADRDHRDRLDADRDHRDRLDADRDDQFDAWRERDHRDARQGDHVFEHGRWIRRPAFAWANLGVLGAGKAVLELDGQTPLLRSIKLDVRGRMRLHRVVILFANGSRQTLAMRAMVDSRMADPVIDLGGPRRVVAMIVYSSPWSRGSIEVSGLVSRPKHRPHRGF